jgi:hypothetical protein
MFEHGTVNLKSLTFYGLQGQLVSEEDLILVKSKVPGVQTFFYQKDINEGGQTL